MVASPERVGQIQATYAACMLTLLVWDWLILLPQEYRCIWKAPICLNKVLFLLSRYYSMAWLVLIFTMHQFEISYPTCTILVHIQPGLGSVVALTSTAILAWRTYSIWGKPRWLAFLICTLMLLELGCLLVGCILVAPVFGPGGSGICLVRGLDGVKSCNFLYFLAPALVDAVLTGLSIHRAAKALRFKQSQMSDILAAFVRHGLVYFTVCTFMWLLEAAFYLQPIESIQPMNAPAAVALSSAMACRLILSTRTITFSNSQPSSPVAEFDVGLDFREYGDGPSPDTINNNDGANDMSKACRSDSPSILRTAISPAGAPGFQDPFGESAVQGATFPRPQSTYFNTPAGRAVARDFCELPRPVYEKELRRPSDISLYA